MKLLLKEVYVHFRIILNRKLFFSLNVFFLCLKLAFNYLVKKVWTRIVVVILFFRKFVLEISDWKKCHSSYSYFWRNNKKISILSKFQSYKGVVHKSRHGLRGRGRVFCDNITKALSWRWGDICHKLRDFIYGRPQNSKCCKTEDNMTFL